MKFTRPTYNSTQQFYYSGVKDGFRLESEVDDSSFSPSIDSLKSSVLTHSIASSIVDLTKSWFSKPISIDWLFPRLDCLLPLPDSSFEGKCIWTLVEFIITKDKFTLKFDLQSLPAEKITLDFYDPPPSPPSPPSPPPVESSPSPVESSSSNSNDLTTRRKDQKSLVLLARQRAAKALFKAERLTQAYVQAYGETDWEDELEEDSDP